MGYLRQYQVTLACSLGNFIIGIVFVWPSYTLKLYTSANTTLLAEPLSDTQSALLGSLPSLGAMVSTMFAGVMLNTLGRQKVGLCVAMPFLLSWLLIDLSSSATLLLLGRFLSGLACGVCFVLAPVFISEIADQSIRGLLAAAPTAFYCFGVLMSFVMGWTLTFKYIIWTNIFLCVLYAALILSVRESPVFLLMKKNEEEARKSIAYYKGLPVDSKPVLAELSRLKQQLMPAFELLTVTADGKIDEAEKEKLNPDHADVSIGKMPPFKMLLFSSTSRRAFTIVAITISFQVMMGMVAVQVYAAEIFHRAAPSLSSDMCSVLFALVLLSGCLSCAFFSDKFGRKPLIIGSSVGVTLCLLSMAFLMQTNIGPAWVIAVLILIFCFSFMFGAGSVPYVLLAEVFLPEVQNLASMLLLELVWLLNFGLVGVFPFMIKFLGIHGSFYFFAVFGVLDILAGIFLVPETKGLSREQIQEALQGRRKT
ncbi:facilitated trehalose transporter Tret1-like isoform X1 [Pieris brassicae]|uniref:facilitated trehalose transporter Tret1-like isoform X1 n=1 Tax=Pieris brassicae TaxID=7116 RepID=UPI001E65FFBD|nr:facilitated trehalose transporter Tret1-like isoform X1 [Pieris brassicae]XP_045524326.1 facilitated trehalose transporter Tret1-like isoform X1 [Pieris brassicae]XP_045524327.1 facilitated trehalose transporter Tret1-like isoform X1 [Pieris brassicae]XP_045524328.1 facilitated trehalose transporter Tret1-like isoform X1 [Pieris brassicae]XP_045524329.1 facilitated trehalose transporter Tret1-like isoform X1 [Pieris brassicae]XP_045524330.1 facilitated trehalose transporter Tret1-like isofo